MSRLTKREKCGLVISAFVLFLYCYFVFFFTPIDHKTKSLRKSILEYRKIEDSKVSEESLRNVENYNKIHGAHIKKSIHGKQSIENLESLQEKLPDMEKNSDIAYNIKVVAENAKVILSTIEFGEIATFKNSPAVKYVPLVLRFTGTLNNIIELLKNLENQDRICEVNKVSIGIETSRDGGISNSNDSSSSISSTSISRNNANRSFRNSGNISNSNSNSNSNSAKSNFSSNSNSNRKNARDMNAKLEVNIRYFYTGVD